ncbi:S-adenosyl-L-methionine-dependent tRNA 4-demethylwyosine synthase TYW1 [Octopus sinensis]|uniref:S-adenosyl-L-methionine-dependent tRNA 4-demethylwyosine synthase TYW1 n=1 Tax=Octopus sinensis TaxID=2607531 RepID=A0A6P7THZ1_9MOLL|nr:S-adenosyl-L-methionine-dependent tRNA 4-demethylwyosine synthase TYW1 [Octopus sinensis]
MLEELLQYEVSEYLRLPVWLLLLAVISFTYLSRFWMKQTKTKVAEVKESVEKTVSKDCKTEVKEWKRSLHILYGSQTGHSKILAESLAQNAEQQGVQVEVLNIKDYDPEDHIKHFKSPDRIYVIIISTYVQGSPPDDAVWFYKWLKETAVDFRVQKNFLEGMIYAVFSHGNSEYKENFSVVGKNIDAWLHQLEANRILPVGIGDEDTTQSSHGGLTEDFNAWNKKFWKKSIPVLKGGTLPVESNKCCKETCEKKCCDKDNNSSNQEVLMETSSEEEEDDADNIESSGSLPVTQSNGLVDLEDLGKVMKHVKKTKTKPEINGYIVSTNKQTKNEEPKPMITEIFKKSLEKQGYSLIGTHSGVKLCRWTKSMLRGRGGCYKHTFYGIESHRCMETTPSLACANKCVFCWRHHTNPVGTEWRWLMDDPEYIFKGAIANHTKMIKQFRGVPGVLPERFNEGMSPKHCALSLVGEPIMYPEINKFIDLLHNKEISTFLVTNAQFPDAIHNLIPVTQLYVSVDASNKESLKKIDRPLFRDFWQRFQDSLLALAEKKQRTVYRLTLVKGWNTDEIEAYANLVDYGKPDFIEVKGVTYCGESKASTLTMKNVPWHEEVCGFVQQLADLLPDYEIACEHEHSNCLLVANKKFKVNGEWWTWIDYEKFHELVQNRKNNSEMIFTAEDYMAKTPDWAVYGAKEHGFDPSDKRFFRKKQKDISGC